MMEEAAVGDEIVIDGRVDAPARKGEVLEVLRTGGVPHYRVRWDDGTDCIFFPGADAHVVHRRADCTLPQGGTGTRAG
jgi:hypothetical protein